MFFFSRKIDGGEVQLQVHRDVPRHQPQRRRTPGGNVGTNSAQGTVKEINRSGLKYLFLWSLQINNGKNRMQ